MSNELHIIFQSFYLQNSTFCFVQLRPHSQCRKNNNDGTKRSSKRFCSKTWSNIIFIVQAVCVQARLLAWCTHVALKLNLYDVFKQKCAVHTKVCICLLCVVTEH